MIVLCECFYTISNIGTIAHWFAFCLLCCGPGLKYGLEYGHGQSSDSVEMAKKIDRFATCILFWRVWRFELNGSVGWQTMWRWFDKWFIQAAVHAQKVMRVSMRVMSHAVEGHDSNLINNSSNTLKLRQWVYTYSFGTSKN